MAFFWFMNQMISIGASTVIFVRINLTSVVSAANLYFNNKESKA
jgi:hypothetical protein